MVTKVYRVTPEMKLWNVIELMIRHQISGAPVVDTLDQVITVIGEGAVLRLAASEGLDATVSHCLPKLTPTKKIITLERHHTFADAYKIFLKNYIHRIPVVDDNGRLKGIVSRGTILRLFLEAHYGKKLTRPAA